MVKEDLFLNDVPLLEEDRKLETASDGSSGLSVIGRVAAARMINRDAPDCNHER